MNQTKCIWQYDPFLSCVDNTDFHLNQPQLSRWLADLTAEQIKLYQGHSDVLCDDLKAAGFAFVDAVHALENASKLPQAQPYSLPQIERGLTQGIPGRKLNQIESLIAVSLKHASSAQWLEWCAGKGYLGRILSAATQKPVTSLEWQNDLCQKGQHFADQHQLPMTFVHGDAFSDKAQPLIRQDQHALALHACGDLHMRLIKLAAANQTNALTISPCCYHLTRDEVYQPLSTCAQSAMLHLSRTDLKIPLQQTMTGGKRVIRHRFEEMSYRLGLAKLLQSLMNSSEYINIPSIKKSQLSQGFQSFCLWAIEYKNIDVSSEIDFDHWQRVGERLFWQMEAIGLIQSLFKRAIEMWLIYDKAMFLEEQNYQVDVGIFCEPQISPRNIYIQASRR